MVSRKSAGTGRPSKNQQNQTVKKILASLAFVPFTPFLVCPAGAQFNPAIAGADSQWVIYADMNGLRASKMGKELIAQAETAQFDPGGIKIHVDVQKLLATVGTITAYGSNFDRRPEQVNGTLIIQGTPEMRTIVRGLLTEATVSSPDRVSELKKLPFEAYAISSGAPAAAAGGSDLAAGRVVIAFPPEPIVLISKSEAQLLRAHEVFAGRSRSLAQVSSSPLKSLVANPQGTFLFAAAVIPSADKLPQDDGPHARILQMARSGSLAVGETGENTFAHVMLVSSSAEMAEKLGRILDGMAAMMSLAESNDQALNEFLKSAAVVRDDNTVALDLSYSSARLAEMIRNMLREQGRGLQGLQARQQAKRAIEDQHKAILAIDVNGKPIANWPVASSPDNGQTGNTGWAWFTLDRVHLANGTSVTLTGRRNGGDEAQFDRVEVTPAEGPGPALVFRPQYMRLVGYRMVNKDPDGGEKSGRRIAATGQVATAQFDFPGNDGVYKVRVHYLAVPQGTATFTLSIKDSDAASEETASHDNSGASEPR